MVKRSFMGGRHSAPCGGPARDLLPHLTFALGKAPASWDMPSQSVLSALRRPVGKGMSVPGPGCVKTRFWWQGLGRIDEADFMLGSLLSIRRRPECALPVSYCRPGRVGPFLYRRS